MKNKVFLIMAAAISCCLITGMCVYIKIRHASQNCYAKHLSETTSEKHYPEREGIVKWAAPKEFCQLTNTWHAISDNMRAGRLTEAETMIQGVSERMKHISWEQWDDIMKPCYEFLEDRLSENTKFDISINPEQLLAFYETNLSCIKMVFEVEMHAHATPHSAGVWEAKALSSLKSYRSMFARHGSDDLACLTDRMIGSLIEQIESRDGLTRRYMQSRYNAEIQFAGKNGLDAVNVIRGIRTYAYPLKVAGYEPTWLREYDLTMKVNP